MLLSIIVPTYNRKEILSYTLSLLKEQVERNIDDVELVVCNNASTDDTLEFLDSCIIKNLRVVNYTDHVEVGCSITRSIENALGEYFLLWSDDDIPSPMLIDSICIKLKEYKNLGCLSFARMNGFSAGVNRIENLWCFTNSFSVYDHYYESSKEFVEEHYSEMDFLSVNVVKMEAWKKGQEIFSLDFFGFEFLAPILYGIQGYKCLYLEYPLCIKRDVPLSLNTYAFKWPLYAYVGIPRILKALEAKGAITDWKKCFREYRYNYNDDEYIRNIFSFCYKNRDFYLPYVEEMVSYQESPYRKKITNALLVSASAMKKERFKYKVEKKLSKIVSSFSLK